MTVINENTVVVFSDLELKSALENDNGYTYIYFGSNISISSGIAISSKKSKVIIDGTYNGVMYEYTDQKKLGTNDTIYVTSSYTSNVTIKNIKVNGYNYYGIIYVPEASAYKNTVIEYNNVNYNGPQMSFNPVGTTRFIDCIINIQDSYASGNEVAECNKIEIGGHSTITHSSTGNSSFWFRNDNPSFTILKDAVVDFTSYKRELFYGTYNLEFTISKDASFSVTTYNGLAYGNYGTGQTLIDENASFSIKQTNRNGSYSTWYSYGTITLNKNSSLVIINNYENISSNNYNIYFQGKQSGLIFNSPRNVFLYNSSANIINTTDVIPFSFSFSRLNLFDKAVNYSDNISKDNLPTYSWYKSVDLSSVSGTFNGTTTTITSNNYTEEELNILPSLNNFIFSNKKSLSIGNLLLHINSLTDSDTIMKGITIPKASILIEYNDVSVVVVAADDGNFSYTYNDTLPIGTNINFTVKMYESLIYTSKEIQIVYSGELTLDSATPKFNFKIFVLSENPIICPRLNDVIIKVTDSRINSSNWKLYATINHNLESDSGIVLEDSLIYVDELNNINILSENPTLVYTGENNGGSVKTTNISWNEDKGILLKLNNPLENNTKYSAEITWILEE